MSTEINPSQYGIAVTPSDSTLLTRTNNGVTYAPRSIYVGGIGTIVAGRVFAGESVSCGCNQGCRF